MILGFLAFCIFIVNSCGGFKLFMKPFLGLHLAVPGEEEPWLHLAEKVHMQLFVAMMIYFVLISRAVDGSIQKIMLWEQMGIRQSRLSDGSAKAMHWQGSRASLLHMDSDLDSYCCWRQFFISTMASWQRQRPALFKDTLERLGIDCAAEDASERFQCVVDEEFSLSTYLALIVASGMCDSIQVHPTTWFVVILLFGVFAVLHGIAKTHTSSLAPAFVVLAMLLLALMKVIVVRRRRYMEQRMLMSSDSLSSGAVSPPCGVTSDASSNAGDCGDSKEVLARVVESIDEAIRGVPEMAEKQAWNAMHLPDETPVDHEEWQLRERCRTEIVMLRMLQIVHEA